MDIRSTRQRSRLRYRNLPLSGEKQSLPNRICRMKGLSAVYRHTQLLLDDRGTIQPVSIIVEISIAKPAPAVPITGVNTTVRA